MFSKHRVLNVAEKPSVAKSITNILTRNSEQEPSKSVYNRIYKFNHNLQDEEVEMFFTSVSGHLTSLKYDDKYKDWNSWDPLIILTQAEIETHIPSDKENLQLNLKKLSKMCDRLILWLDCDREGENIAFQVLDVCRSVNPNIQVARAHFSAVTRADIFRALGDLRPPDENLSNAVKARQEIDLRIGASFTRFQTLLLRKNYALKSVISYGPCQFPTLGFVVQRYKEIQEFAKEKFWYISCKYQETEFNWERGNMFDEIIVMMLYEKCYAQVATVQNFTCKNIQKYKPLPLSTIEFEKLASKKLKISAHRAMEIAEKLYNQGYISYPRTETNKFPTTMNLKDFVQIQSTHPIWGNYAADLLNYNYDSPRAGVKDDKAHPPIHPVKMLLSDQAENQEVFKVYELIVRHFLACCSKNAQGNETQIELEVNNEQFNKSGLQITQLNYLEVYPYDVWSQSTVPKLERNQQIQVTLQMKGGFTSPPKQLSESELITLMDQNGIGTDATIHEHMKTIQEREYAIKAGQIFKPTKLGIALVESYEQLGFTLHQPHLRALMEQRMNLVALGQYDMKLMITETIQEMEIILKQMQQNKIKFIVSVGTHLERLANYQEDTDTPLTEEPFGNCGICGNEIMLRDYGDIKQLHCQTCNKKYQLPYDGKPTPKQEHCQICHFQLVQIQKSNRQSYTICPNCTNDQEFMNTGSMHPIQAKRNPVGNMTQFQPQGQSFKCDLCQTPMSVRTSNKGTQFIGCSNFPQCKQTAFLPKYMKTIQISDQKCQKCNNSMYKVQFNAQEEIYGNMKQRATKPNATFCLYPGCDIDVMVKWADKQNNQGMRENMVPINRQNNNEIHNNQQNTNNQEKPQVTCYHCQQVGHYANVCPNKNTKYNQKQQPQQQQQQQQQPKQCQSCGIQGRHPKNSDCPKKLRKKQKNSI